MSQPSTSLTCPKCHGSMRMYERSGVHVDQCAECRGVFLDRGELEHLVDAESTFYDRPAATPTAPAPAAPRGYEHGYQPYPQRKKKSFLGELFD